MLLLHLSYMFLKCIVISFIFLTLSYKQHELNRTMKKNAILGEVTKTAH